jgi:hypothetical protein
LMRQALNAPLGDHSVQQCLPSVQCAASSHSSPTCGGLLCQRIGNEVAVGSSCLWLSRQFSSAANLCSAQCTSTGTPSWHPRKVSGANHKRATNSTCYWTLPDKGVGACGWVLAPPRCPHNVPATRPGLHTPACTSGQVATRSSCHAEHACPRHFLSADTMQLTMKR